MTPKERRNPDLLKASRKKRIAAGSGTKVEDINKLLKMHRQMADMMKEMGAGKRGPMAGLGDMMGMGGGMPSPGTDGEARREDARRSCRAACRPAARHARPAVDFPGMPGLGGPSCSPGFRAWRRRSDRRSSQSGSSRLAASRDPERYPLACLDSDRGFAPRPARRDRNDSTIDRRKDERMSLKIRLARAGTKKRPFYHIVVADARSPRDGRFIEKIGNFDPMLPKDETERVKLDLERVKHWLAKGAQPTDRVAALPRRRRPDEARAAQQPREGAMPGKKAQERAEELRRRRRRRGRQGARPQRRRRSCRRQPRRMASRHRRPRRSRICVAPHRRGPRHRGRGADQVLHRRSDGASSTTARSPPTSPA